MSNVFDGLIEKARHTGKRIILTESEDQRVLDAAKKAAALDLCKVVLLGKKDELESNKREYDSRIETAEEEIEKQEEKQEQKQEEKSAIVEKINELNEVF